MLGRTFALLASQMGGDLSDLLPAEGIGKGDPSKWSAIPADGDCVTAVNFADRGLYGPILAALWKLTGVKSIHLCDNDIAGRLSDKISDLISLEVFYLSSTGVSGPIPALPLSIQKFKAKGASRPFRRTRGASQT